MPTGTWFQPLTWVHVQGNFKFSGLLTDSVRQIEIRPVTLWSDGKSATMKIIIGYEFFLNGKSLGAVQASPNTFHKKYVWLRNVLPNELKLVIASSSATLRVKAEGQSDKLDR